MSPPLAAGIMVQIGYKLSDWHFCTKLTSNQMKFTLPLRNVSPPQTSPCIYRKKIHDQNWYARNKNFKLVYCRAKKNDKKIWNSHIWYLKAK